MSVPIVITISSFCYTIYNVISIMTYIITLIPLKFHYFTLHYHVIFIMTFDKLYRIFIDLHYATI